METIDFKKEFPMLFKPSSKEFSVVTAPSLKYLMIDGEGDPNISRDYAEAIEAIYSVAYALKFMSNMELGRDYAVPPLEGMWWVDGMEVFANQ